MSYSYIKSVFPNFENSNKVYDEALYNNINTLYTDSSLGLPKPENLESLASNYNKDTPQKDIFQLYENKILKETAPVKLEAMSNVNEYSEVPLFKPEHQNNLSYYNLPLNVKEQPKIIRQEKKQIEGFEEQVSQKLEVQKIKCEDQDCDQYIKHILECSKCKAIAMKQLGVESDRFRNEEMMELASYVMFGLFILLLIDSLKSSHK